MRGIVEPAGRDTFVDVHRDVVTAGGAAHAIAPLPAGVLFRAVIGPAVQGGHFWPPCIADVDHVPR